MSYATKYLDGAGISEKNGKEIMAARQILDGHSRRLSLEIAEKVLGRRVQ